MEYLACNRSNRRHHHNGTLLRYQSDTKNMDHKVILTSKGEKPIRVHLEVDDQVQEDFLKIKREHPEMDDLKAMAMAVKPYLK